MEKIIAQMEIVHHTMERRPNVHQLQQLNLVQIPEHVGKLLI